MKSSPKKKNKIHASENHVQKFRNLLSKLELHFNDDQLLYQAFTHSSYVNEKKHRADSDNERLEFLGDAVLELCVSQYLYRRFHTMQEGEMTKLRAAVVCEPSLAELARSYHFGSLVFLGKGEDLTGGRERSAMLADVFEAFVGALYLDQGMDAVHHFLEKTVYEKIETGSYTDVMDFKSQLQEFVQRASTGTVAYEIVDEQGPAHSREFVARVSINGDHQGEGVGKTKKSAEQHAAQKTLMLLSAGNE
ncbi:ribonuclease III [Salicibibacter halophilus]|uniref:Ribonuclease 3 n=1 Tax=Salicibibacter halophilus TaxID=2502791 RepID=A0A514LH02_9BACI|nr:ribonuclease III [Salicibibacter halophilus]QDI90551.1 ribonuclease III [Salicibibacter halophilus]